MEFSLGRTKHEKGQQNRHDMFISMMILWNHHFKMKKMQ